MSGVWTMMILQTIAIVWGVGFVVSLLLFLSSYLKEVCEVLTMCAAWPIIVVGAGYHVIKYQLVLAWKKLKKKIYGKEN